MSITEAVISILAKPSRHKNVMEEKRDMTEITVGGGQNEPKIIIKLKKGPCKVQEM